MPIDASQVFKLADVMGQVADEVTKTQIRAVNKVQVTIRKVAQQEIRKTSPLKAAWVRNAIVPRRATQKPEIRFAVREKGIPLRVRGPTSIKDPWYRATKLKRGTIKGKFTKSRAGAIKGAFSHDHFAGSRVFKREGRSRYPIKRIFGPSIWAMFQRRRVQRAMDQSWQSKLPIELRRAEDQTLKKHGLI